MARLFFKDPDKVRSWSVVIFPECEPSYNGIRYFSFVGVSNCGYIWQQDEMPGAGFIPCTAAEARDILGDKFPERLFFRGPADLNGDHTVIIFPGLPDANGTSYKKTWQGPSNMGAVWYLEEMTVPPAYPSITEDEARELLGLFFPEDGVVPPSPSPNA